MQLTCRDWALATAPTELCVKVPAWKQHEALAGVLHVASVAPPQSHGLMACQSPTNPAASHLSLELALFLLLPLAAAHTAWQCSMQQVSALTGSCCAEHLERLTARYPAATSLVVKSMSWRRDRDVKALHTACQVLSWASRRQVLPAWAATGVNVR